MRVSYTVGRSGAITFGEDSDVQVVRGDPRWQGGEAYILITSTVDKNVNSSKIWTSPIPDMVLEVECVRVLESYLRPCRPPSGGYLFAAPLGHAGFRKTVYTAVGDVVKQSYRRAYPGQVAVKLGGSSLRKSWPQWMESAGNTDREIVDVCGWSRKAIKDKMGTAQLYYDTQLEAQLRIKRDLHVALAAAKKSMA